MLTAVDINLIVDVDRRSTAVSMMHVLSELLLLQRARCERPKRAYIARMVQLQQRCKQQRQLKSLRSTVQLHATSGNMVSCMATVAGRLRRRRL